MKSTLYDSGRAGFLDGSINWDRGDIRVCLVKAAYIPDFAYHGVMADLKGNDNGRSDSLVGKTIGRGVADADDTALVATGGGECNALVIYQHTGDDATARLIAYISELKEGLPFTALAGQRVTIEWDDGPNKIFKL